MRMEKESSNETAGDNAPALHRKGTVCCLPVKVKNLIIHMGYWIESLE